VRISFSLTPNFYKSPEAFEGRVKIADIAKCRRRDGGGRA